MATLTETGTGAENETAVEAPSARSRAPWVALAGTVVAAFVAYTVLGIAVDVPRVHPDEVRYLIAASSLVEGEGLALRGGDYGFGPLLALVLAAILWLSLGSSTRRTTCSRSRTRSSSR